MLRKYVEQQSNSRAWNIFAMLQVIRKECARVVAVHCRNLCFFNCCLCFLCCLLYSSREEIAKVTGDLFGFATTLPAVGASHTIQRNGMQCSLRMQLIGSLLSFEPGRALSLLAFQVKTPKHSAQMFLLPFWRRLFRGCGSRSLSLHVTLTTGQYSLG